jgi:glutamate racemase
VQAVHPVQVVQAAVPPVEKVPAEHEVQVLATLSNPNAAVHPEQAPVVAMQAVHPVQVVQAAVPPVEKVPAEHEVQVLATLSNPNAAVHPEQAPVVKRCKQCTLYKW